MHNTYSTNVADSTSHTHSYMPDDFEETVTEEEWEEERNGVMVKVRKKTTKRTRMVSRPSTNPSQWRQQPFWQFGTSTSSSDLSTNKFDYVSMSSHIKQHLDELIKDASKSYDDSE